MKGVRILILNLKRKMDETLGTYLPLVNTISNEIVVILINDFNFSSN